MRRWRASKAFATHIESKLSGNGHRRFLQRREFFQQGFPLPLRLNSVVLLESGRYSTLPATRPVSRAQFGRGTAGSRRAPDAPGR